MLSALARANSVKWPLAPFCGMNIGEWMLMMVEHDPGDDVTVTVRRGEDVRVHRGDDLQ